MPSPRHRRKAPAFLTVKEAADMVRCDAQVIYRACRRGDLPAQQIPTDKPLPFKRKQGKILIDPADLAAWLEPAEN